MSFVIAIVSLIAACMCIALGAVRLGSWLIAYRDGSAQRSIRDEVLVAQARAELADREYAIAMLDQEAMTHD